MALTTFDKARLSGNAAPYRIAVEIRSDLYGIWCDINKPGPAAAGDVWFNRLLKPPKITVKSEVEPGRFASSISTLLLDDSDGLFGNSLPLTIYDSLGTAGRLDAWYRRKVRIRIGHHVESKSAWAWESLGVFLIEDIERDSTSQTAKMKLLGLEKTMMDASAEDVRRGDSWCVNIPIPLLVSELRRKVSEGPGAISFATGSPPAHCRQTTNDNELSLLGNCPPKTGTADWNDHTEVVPRYIFTCTQGDRLGELYLCGYRKKDGRAAYARWRRTATGEPWDVKTFTIEGDDLTGWEITYGIQGTGAYAAYVWLFFTRNESGSIDAWSCGNTRLVVAAINPADGSFVSGFSSSVWATNTLSWSTYVYGSPTVYNYWGNRTTTTGAYNPAVFFPSRVSILGKGHSADERIGTTTNNYSQSKPDRYNAIDSAKNIASYSAWDDSVLPGYYTFNLLNQASYNLHMRMPTHTASHECFKHSAARGRVLWMRWIATSPNDGYWQIASFDIGSAATVYYSRIYFGNSYEGNVWTFHERHVTAWDIRVDASGGGTCFIAFANVDPNLPGILTPGLVRFSYVEGANMTSPTNCTFSGTLLTEDISANYMPILVTLRMHWARNAVWGQVANYAAAGGHAYGLWYWSASTAGSNAVFVNAGDSDSTLPLSTVPFALSTGERTAGGFNQYWYIQDQGTGTIWSMRWTGDSYMTVFPPISVGEPVDAESTWASSNLCWDNAYSTLYGASAANSPAWCRMDFKEYGDWPSDPPLAQYTPGGRLSFWHYAAELGDIVKVADFGDASIWDGIEMCREIAGNYVAGMDRSGALMFKARPTSGDTVVEIRERGDQAILTDGTHAPADKIVSHLDHRAIANNITIPTYTGEASSVDYHMILTPDSKADNVGIAIQYTGTAAQRVVLRCTRGGVAKTDSTTSDQIPLLFSWSRIHADLTTALAQAAEPDAPQIRVYGIYDGGSGDAYLGDTRVRVGDTCFVEDGNVCTIASINIASGILVFESGDTVGGADTHRIGATVTITPHGGSRYSDSLDGVCKLTTQFSHVGTYGSMYVDSTELLSPGMVLFRDTSYAQVIEVISSTEAYVKKKVINTGSGQGAWPVDTVLRGAIWIEYASYGYAISNTGLSVSIFPQTKETYGKGYFREGDRIIITSSGLVAKKIEHAVVRAVNSASVKRYGKREYRPRVENRLMTQQRARLLLSSQMMHLAWPPHVTSAYGLPLLTGIEIGDLVNVRHTYLFPDGDHTVTHGVTGITWDLADGTMELSMRSVESAGRAGEDLLAAAPPVPAWTRYERYRRR